MTLVFQHDLGITKTYLHNKIKFLSKSVQTGRVRHKKNNRRHYLPEFHAGGDEAVQWLSTVETKIFFPIWCEFTWKVKKQILHKGMQFDSTEEVESVSTALKTQITKNVTFNWMSLLITGSAY